jgi:hypothetical protein
MESLLPALAVFALTAAAALTVWSAARSSWSGVPFGALAAILGSAALIAILNTPAIAKERKQEPVAGCAYSSFPVCEPFKGSWERLEWFYGPAISTAIQWDGRLTQCFVRGCLQHFPELPGYEVQAMLLGQRYLESSGQPAQSLEGMVLPSLPSRWLADKGRTTDLLRLLGQPLTGAAYDPDLGRMRAVWQRAVLSWPEESNDLADLRIEELGKRFYTVLAVEDPPWWSAFWLRLSLVVSSLSMSALALVRALFAPGESGAF